MTEKNRKEGEDGNRILMILTNQLDRAHMNQLKDTSAKFKLSKSGGYESCGDTELRHELLVSPLRLPAEE